jgi:NADP-dependent aldehyde dehydrogenase
MTHGGPYPATSDGRSTSVGTGYAIRAPGVFSKLSDAVLPEELRKRIR